MAETQKIISKPYAVVIGGANMDICGSATNKIILNDSNIGKISASSGGVARNIAENLALLQSECHLLTAIGEDHFGQSLINHAKNVGIKTDDILILDSEKTSTYLSVIDEEGEMMVAINDMTIIENITPDYLKRHNNLIENSTIIIADTNITKESLSYLINNLKNVPILIDTVSTEKALKIKDCLHGIHSLKTNKLEAEALTGISNNLSEMADWFHNHGVLKVYITMGSDGVFYSDANKVGEIKHHKKHGDVKNVTGAGDAFSAGVAYAYLKDWAMVKSVHFAMAAAACALNHENTINPEMSVKKITRIMEQEYDN